MKVDALSAVQPVVVDGPQRRFGFLAAFPVRAVAYAGWFLISLACARAHPVQDPVLDGWKSGPVRFQSPEAEKRGLLDNTNGWTQSSTGAESGREVEDQRQRLGDDAGTIESLFAKTGSVSFDIPMSDDPRVAWWLDRLSSRSRRSFARWLGRSTRYVPAFWRILDGYGLPKDTVFLSMVESGFSSRAYSWAHAAGPWQMMPRTARRFGLRVGFWVDERRDFEKSTHAAAKYLIYLFKEFGDWHLTFAAYNAGGGKIRRAIRRTGSRDFWLLSRTAHLRRETKQYVPKILAAAQIAKEPDRYGFGSVTYLAPVDWEVLTVTVATDLQTLSHACEVAFEELEELNPELRLGVTPPGVAYSLRVPDGARPRCEIGLKKLPEDSRLSYRYHRVRDDDTISSLAKRYGASEEQIRVFNRVGSDRIDLEELVIPMSLALAVSIPVREPDPGFYRGERRLSDGRRLIRYRVRRGDSLWRIAKRFGVGLQKLRRWNGLWRTSHLSMGRSLRIYVR